jgi:hypothetical protein
MINEMIDLKTIQDLLGRASGFAAFRDSKTWVSLALGYHSTGSCR